MDLYNRYFMRASGEKKHQPSTQAEALTFSTFDFLREEKFLLNNEEWKCANDQKRNEIMVKFCEQMQRTLNQRL